MQTKDHIKAGRMRLGMTHQAFGDAVGVSRGAVQQWEKGDTEPTRKHQPRVAALLGISVAELMHGATGEGPMTLGQQAAPVASADSGKSEPTLAQALEVVLDAMAESPHRSELRQLLPMVVDTNAGAYRQRLGELLARPNALPRPGAESKDFYPKPPSFLFDKSQQPT